MVALWRLCYSIIPGTGGPVIISGPLPAEGGVLDQDNATMEAMTVIRSEMIEVLSKAAEKARKKAKK